MLFSVVVLCVLCVFVVKIRSFLLRPPFHPFSMWLNSCGFRTSLCLAASLPHTRKCSNVGECRALHPALRVPRFPEPGKQATTSTIVILAVPLRYHLAPSAGAMSTTKIARFLASAPPPTLLQPRKTMTQDFRCQQMSTSLSSTSAPHPLAAQSKPFKCGGVRRSSVTVYRLLSTVHSRHFDCNTLFRL
jgi:hypothetical protein